MQPRHGSTPTPTSSPPGRPEPTDDSSARPTRGHGRASRGTSRRARGQRGVAEDQVGGLLGHHHHRGVDVAVGDVAHRRGVDHPQAFQAVHRIVSGSTTAVVVGRRPSGTCTTGAARSRRPCATQSRICSSVSTVGPGEISPPSNGGHRRLAEDVAGDADRLDPLAPVLLGREVVEAQRRLGRGVGRRDLHRARARRSTSGRCAPGSRARRPAPSRRSGSRSAGSGTSGWGRRRRRCCARSRPPRSGWWRPGPCAGTATAAPMNGRFHIFIHGCIDTGCVHACWM